MGRGESSSPGPRFAAPAIYQQELRAMTQALNERPALSALIHPSETGPHAGRLADATRKM